MTECNDRQCESNYIDEEKVKKGILFKVKRWFFYRRHEELLKKELEMDFKLRRLEYRLIYRIKSLERQLQGTSLKTRHPNRSGNGLEGTWRNR